MSAFIAALPMYDWPECRAESDAEWATLRDGLRVCGVDAPEALVRRNADMPPVPGGIRDRDGRPAAPDPATLPPDGLHLPTLWRHPQLLFAQTCWGPLETGLAAHVRVLGQPDYSAYEGGEGTLYSSAILMRRNDISPSPPRASPEPPPPRWVGAGNGRASSRNAIRLRGRGAEPSEAAIGVLNPIDRSARIPITLLRGKRLAFNAPDSLSGFLALAGDLGAMGEGVSLFSECIETGAHRASVLAVAAGKADVCAVDCRSWALMKRFEPAAGELAVVGWTAKRKGLPYIMSAALPEALAAALRNALRGPVAAAEPAAQADSRSSSG